MQPLWAASGVANGDNLRAGLFRFVPVGCCDMVPMRLALERVGWRVVLWMARSWRCGFSVDWPWNRRWAKIDWRGLDARNVKTQDLTPSTRLDLHYICLHRVVDGKRKSAA
jgi:hypothetical protein